MFNDSPTLIVAVPGTQETQEMPRQAVLEAIRRGEITPDQWIWSPSHNEWKPAAELPELQGPELQPVPEPAPTPVLAPTTFMNGAVPKTAMSAHFPPAAARQVAAAPAATAPQPQRAHTPALSDTQMLARTQYSQPMEVKHEFPIFKVIFFVMFLIVAGILAANYLLVEKPFAANFATTAYASVPAYVHLGAFTQPGALVVHVPPTAAVNADNFADFLAALAKSTPPQPFNSGPFDGVGITSSWQSQYVMNGRDWQTLAQMTDVSGDERKKFEIEHFVQIDGTPLAKIRKNEDPANITAIEDKAWQSLVANFQSKS